MFIAFILFPEMMFFIPKHIEYNYSHYSFIRTTHAQNTIMPFLLCEVSAAILDFILISWLFFKPIVRNAFLAPKYPRVEVLLMIVAPKGQ